MTQAYSSETDTHYPSWEALIEAEANGYVVVAIVSDGKKTWPYTEGPYPDKRQATNARNRMKTRFKKDVEWDQTRSIHYSIRPLWRPDNEEHAVYWLHHRLYELYPQIDGYAHETASDEVKTEIDFLLNELKRKGWDPVYNLLANERNSGWGYLPWFYRIGEWNGTQQTDTTFIGAKAR